VVLLGFLLVPVFGWLVSKTTGAPFIYRYTLSCVAGFACLTGVAVAKKPLMGIVVLFALLCQIGVDFGKFQRGSFILEPSVSLPISTYMPDFSRRYAWMKEVPDKNLPIALLDDLDFLPTLYYGPADLASRLVYVVWPYSDDNGQGWLRLSHQFSVGKFSRLSEFLNSNRTFLAYGRPLAPWRLDHLIRDGAGIRVEKVTADHFLVQVSYKSPALESRP